MGTDAKAKILYILVWFWLILGVESYIVWSGHILAGKLGESITIPCHYDETNPPQKKYWYSDMDTSHKYTNTTEENLSVIDHADQSLFTVTLRNLQSYQTGRYYCAVETEEKETITYKPYLQVEDAPEVSVMSSSVSGHEGEDVTVKFIHKYGNSSPPKRWCRYKDGSCFTEKTTDTSVQISDDDGKTSFTVLMTGLRLSDSGWYFCSAWNMQVPVQLTVTDNKSVWNEKDMAFIWLPTSVAILLFLILVGVFIWIRRERSKQENHLPRETNGTKTTDMIYSKPDDHAIYSFINDDNPNDPKKDITYSTIDCIPGSEAKPPGRIYCTVAPH